MIPGAKGDREREKTESERERGDREIERDEELANKHLVLPP